MADETDEGVMFTREAGERVLSEITEWEKYAPFVRKLYEEGLAPRPDRQQQTFVEVLAGGIVKFASVPVDEGTLYPGKVVYRRKDTGAWYDATPDLVGFECLVGGPNGEALVEGTRYGVFFAGFKQRDAAAPTTPQAYEDWPVFMTVGAAGGGEACCEWGGDTNSLYNFGVEDTNGVLPFPVTPVEGTNDVVENEGLGNETFDHFLTLSVDGDVVKATAIEIPPHTTARVWGQIELRVGPLRTVGNENGYPPSFGFIVQKAQLISVDGSLAPDTLFGTPSYVCRGQFINLSTLFENRYFDNVDLETGSHTYITGDLITLGVANTVPNQGDNPDAFNPLPDGGFYAIEGDDTTYVVIEAAFGGHTNCDMIISNPSDDVLRLAWFLPPAFLVNVEGYGVAVRGVGRGITTLQWKDLCCAGEIIPETPDGTGGGGDALPPSPPPPPLARGPTVVSKTANYTVDEWVDAVKGDATGGAFTVTLPDASARSGRKVTVKKMDSSGNSVSVLAPTTDASTQKIDASPAAVSITTQYLSLTFESDGTDWIIV